MTAPESDPEYGKNQPLSYSKVQVVKVQSGGTFDLKAWRKKKLSESYSISAADGILSNDNDPNRDVYNVEEI